MSQVYFPCIDIIPIETLTSILAYLPYSRQRHGELRFVSKRFRDIIESSTFPFEVASKQFPEHIALLDLKTINNREELDDLARYEAHLSRAVQIYANAKFKTSAKASARSQPASNTTKKFLSSGLRLLDYIVAVYEGHEHWKFPVLLGHGMLDPGLCLLLRTTIGRLYKYVRAENRQKLDYASAFELVSTLRNCGVPAIQTPVDRILDLACQRSFERSVLCLDWSSLPGDLCHPSFTLLNKPMQEVVLEEYASERQKLASSLICATPMGELLLVMDSSARDDELLKAVEWRILSRDIDLTDPAFADTRGDIYTNPLLIAEFMHQRMCDALDEDADNDGQQAASVSEVDWSEVGESIRKCAEQVLLTVEMEKLKAS